MRVALGLIAGLLFAAISLANLCWPEARGPADQGDFARIVARFSSGPVGMPFWPEASDPIRAQRFSRFHLRFWQLDHGEPGWPQATTSQLVVYPERYLRLPWQEPTYDLKRNTLYVIVLLGAAIGATVACLTTPVAAATLLAASLLLSDLQIVWYLNSFYQDAGTYVFTVLSVCLLFAWMERRSTALLAASFVALALLAASKLAYASSAAVLALGLTAAALVGPRRGRVLATCVAGSALVALVAVQYTQAVRTRYQGEIVYNFLFTAALPALRPDERPGYLAELGLPVELAERSGRSAYDPAFAPPDAASGFDNRLHTRAVRLLAEHHPLALLGALASAFSRSGVYDLRQDGYGYRERGAPPVEALRIDAWTRWRSRALAGWAAYGLAAAALAGAALGVRPSRASPRLLSLLALGGAFLAASIVQVPVAMLGNGYPDLIKHLYFANLCCDLALVLGAGAVGERIAGGASSTSRQRRPHRAAARAA